MIAFIFVASFIIFNAISACPEGSIQYMGDSKICYYFIKEKSEFFDAEMACQSLRGHLVSVHSMFQNRFITGEAAITFIESDENNFWIGGFSTTLSEDNWKWTDNSFFDYKQAFSNKTESNGTALSIEMREGEWAPLDSSKKLPFVCGVKNSAPINHCQMGWIYYRPSHSCFGISYRGQQHPIITAWDDAKRYCNNLGADLPSFHDVNEFYVSQAFIISTMRPIWIGLQSIDYGATWTWSDGSAVNYLPPWRKDYGYPTSTSISCGMANISFIENHNCNSRAWTICKQPALGDPSC